MSLKKFQKISEKTDSGKNLEKVNIKFGKLLMKDDTYVRF